MDETRAIVPIEADERGELSLAWEMTAAYMDYARFHREQMGKTAAEAYDIASDPADDSFLDMLRRQQPQQVSWQSINALAERDPALARQV